MPVSEHAASREPRAESGKLRWGVLGAARIAVEKVVPAMRRCRHAEVTAIASRDLGKAQRAASALQIPKAYGSYEALLADPDVDVIYNPLPNHLHVPWSIRAAERGKHVLCEKPIALTAAEARELLAARDRTGVHIQEAFMVRTHPQWLRAAALVESGRIGDVRAIVGVFSFFNRDAANIRNVPSYGGGAVMDIGCYLIHTSRLLLRREPARVMALVDSDPELRIDRLTTMILDYGTTHAVGTCSIQMVPYQRIQVFGEGGRIELQIPFNAPNDRPCRLLVDDGSDLTGANQEVIDVATCDQYAIQADLLSEAIRDRRRLAPYPLEDSIKNMAVIDAILRSGSSGRWECPDV